MKVCFKICLIIGALSVLLSCSNNDTSRYHKILEEYYPYEFASIADMEELGIDSISFDTILKLPTKTDSNSVLDNSESKSPGHIVCVPKDNNLDVNVYSSKNIRVDAYSIGANKYREVLITALSDSGFISGDISIPELTKASLSMLWLILNSAQLPPADIEIDSLLHDNKYVCAYGKINGEIFSAGLLPNIYIQMGELVKLYMQIEEHEDKKRIGLVYKLGTIEQPGYSIRILIRFVKIQSRYYPQDFRLDRYLENNERTHLITLSISKLYSARW